MLRTKEFGTYEIVRKLARGMTDVYLAFDTRANRYAVLKIVEESPDPLTQLILEAERRGAELQRQLHEADSRVVEIYDYGAMDGYFFIAMQYIEGRTVAESLRTVLRPKFELVVLSYQSLEMPLFRVGRGEIPECRAGKRAIEARFCCFPK